MADPSPILTAIIGLVTGITTTVAGALRVSASRRTKKQDQFIKALLDNAGKTALLNERIGQLSEALVRLGDLTVRIEAVEQTRQGSNPDDATRSRAIDDAQRQRAASRVRTKIGRTTGASYRIDSDE